MKINIEIIKQEDERSIHILKNQTIPLS